MSKVNVLGEQQISMIELKEELKKIKKRDEELNFRAQRTEDYLNTVVLIKKKQADDLRKALKKLDVQRLKDEHMTKIIDLQPGTVEELKTIMSAYIVTLTNENLKKIVDTVKSSLK